MSRPITPAQERFERFIDRSGACWLWTGVRAGHAPHQYGVFRVGTREDDPKVYVHRYAYELWVGPIPEGMQVDHVKARGCESKLCVNPDHLEAVSGKENHRRKRLEVCRAGLHDLTDPANVSWDKHGRRRGCKQCSRDRSREYQRQKALDKRR